MIEVRTRADTSSRVAMLAAVCLAALVLPLSFSGGAVATPAIGRDLGGSAVALNWITNAFMLTFGSALMAAGTLADRYGRKRIFAIGIIAFVAVSLACSVAPSVLVLDLLRALQGLAAAAALAGGSAALAQEFDGQARTRAFSMLGTTFGVGLAFGPILAGALIDYGGWHCVFLSTTIIGTLALLVGVPRMRESRDPDAVRIDWPGTITFMTALALFTFGVIQAPASGWSSPVVLSVFVGAAAAAVIFVVVELRARRPMLDLSLFRYPRFLGVQVLPIATCYCYVVLLVALPLRFIGVEGRSEIDAGLLMIALSTPIAIVPVLAATLTRWCSPATIAGAGLLIAAAGLFWLGTIAVPSAPHRIVPAMLMIGLGAGLPWGLMDGLSVSVVPKERAGMATGIFSTMRVAGEGIALALVGTALATLIAHELRDIPHASDAAQLLAMGNLADAVATLPGVERAALIAFYSDSFRTLTHALAALTVVSALAVFAFLGQDLAEPCHSIPKPAQ